MLTAWRLKANQCTTEGGHIISMIIEFERVTKVQFDHIYVKTK